LTPSSRRSARSRRLWQKSWSTFEVEAARQHLSHHSRRSVITNRQFSPPTPLRNTPISRLHRTLQPFHPSALLFSTLLPSPAETTRPPLAAPLLGSKLSQPSLRNLRRIVTSTGSLQDCTHRYKLWRMRQMKCRARKRVGAGRRETARGTAVRRGRGRGVGSAWERRSQSPLRPSSSTS